MDFILDHNDDSIPDATSGTASTSSAQSHGESMANDDDDEDAAALRAAYNLKAVPASQADSSAANVEARVSRRDLAAGGK
jgi:UBX domain-containing protein 1/4